MKKSELIEQARAVLRANDAGTHTRPAPGLYPHQWLWDSCFSAIGISHHDPQRAAEEIYSMLEGQWSNGMVPHMIFVADDHGAAARGHRFGDRFWQAQRSPHAPKHRHTSGITQPPLLAEACWRIAQNMKKSEAKGFLKRVYPNIVAYHQWLYRERDPDGNGIVALFHPWETGLDNAPGWMAELRAIHTPLWLRIAEQTGIIEIGARLLRRDLHHVNSDERMSNADGMRLTHVALSLKKHNYDPDKIFRNPNFVIESLSFNSILIGNNQRLIDIAHFIDEQLPGDLVTRFDKAKDGIQKLWHPQSGSFCHRNYLTGKLVHLEGISKLLPLYSGAISKRQAELLVEELRDDKRFWLPFPAPSVSMASPDFKPRKYWQGPTWINTNWLLIDGLRKYGFEEEAEHIKKKSIQLFEKSGSFEYFSPLDGSGAGSPNFSWTAALIVDLLCEKH